MIALVLLFLAQAAPVVSTEALSDDHEIVVMARKSHRWRGTWHTEEGVSFCKTVISSGDPDIDAIGCANMLICGPAVFPEMITLVKAAQAAGKIKTQEDANRAALPAAKKMGQCMDSKWRRALRELRERRRSAR